MKLLLTIISISAFFFILAYSESDAGGKWTQITTLDSNENGNTWELIDSYDSLHAAIAGSDANGVPRVALTDDGGKTWRYALNASLQEFMNNDSLPFSKPYALHYDPDKIFISALDMKDYTPYLLKSFDGGKTWSFEISAFYGTAIEFDGPKGFMAGDTLLYYTSDNGATWQEKSINIPETNIIAARKFRINSINSFRMLKIDNIKEKAYICKTTDMGDTWKVDSVPYLCWYVDFDFSDDDNGWVAGGYSTGVGDLENDVILRTTDGGSTWNKALDASLKDNVSLPFGLQAVEAINKDEAIAVGSTMRALYTSDGGSTWSLLTNGLKNMGSLFWNVKAINSKTIVACGGGFESNLVAVYNFDSDASVTERETEILTLRPNPAVDYIQLPGRFSQENSVSIYDQLGRKLIETTATAGRIDVSGLPTGIYYLHENNRSLKFLKI